MQVAEEVGCAGNRGIKVGLPGLVARPDLYTAMLPIKTVTPQQ